ncbi:hypothetical protein A5630_06955 [Mycolicibacterium mucogenicum]|uniref:Uncharacterized protein n=1 Tax=Mycolicibacterium mucogenicum TaxID=56689 RepID=A0A1A3GKL2_MYCMU|nr:hypothetical protein [Mycolicibacterium mucogenicum]OBJ36582.1 hypothetical protein A5630_06955 [Mycolicibacterium mucogenicum]
MSSDAAKTGELMQETSYRCMHSFEMRNSVLMQRFSSPIEPSNGLPIFKFVTQRGGECSASHTNASRGVTSRGSRDASNDDIHKGRFVHTPVSLARQS